MRAICTLAVTKGAAHFLKSKLTSCLPRNLYSVGSTIPLTHRTARALLYGVTVFLSLFIMLIFMTYNVSCARGNYVLCAIGLNDLGMYRFGNRAI